MTPEEMFELLRVVDPSAERLPLGLAEFGQAIERRVRAEYQSVGRVTQMLGMQGPIVLYDVDPATLEPATVLYAKAPQ
jgi:hypothetical protein